MKNKNQNIRAISIMPRKRRLVFGIFVAFSLILSGLGYVLNTEKASAAAATPDQIQSFNNAVSGGKKEAYIFTIDNTNIENSNSYSFRIANNLGDGSVVSYSVYCDLAGNRAPINGKYRKLRTITCDYDVPGEYTIAVVGTYDQLRHYGASDDYFRDLADRRKLISVDQWGSTEWYSMHSMFVDATDFNKFPDPAVEIPNTSKLEDMRDMFIGASSFNQPMGSWDVSNVKYMGGMFSTATSFNQPLSDWDVSNVVDMNRMFYAADSFNQSLGNWTISDTGDAEANRTKLSEMLDITDLSVANYESTLLGWANNPNTANGVTLGANTLEYCDPTGRNVLIAKGWTISGDRQLTEAQCRGVDFVPPLMDYVDVIIISSPDPLADTPEDEIIIDDAPVENNPVEEVDQQVVNEAHSVEAPNTGVKTITGRVVAVVFIVVFAIAMSVIRKNKGFSSQI